MNKKIREQVFNKFDGRCAYTGTLLKDDWQIDHLESKVRHEWKVYRTYIDLNEIQERLKEVNSIDNLFPAQKIVNHYKRSLGLEGFRDRMKTFHLRLAKLPKKTKVEATKKRIKYMNEVAEIFSITVNKPFSGLFYFETLNND